MNADPPVTPTPDRLLTRVMLRELIPVSDMAIWRWIKKGIFPEPIKFNGRCYWRASEIQTWIDERSPSRSVTSKPSSTECDARPANSRKNSPR